MILIPLPPVTNDLMSAPHVAASTLVSSLWTALEDDRKSGVGLPLIERTNFYDTALPIACRHHTAMFSLDPAHDAAGAMRDFLAPLARHLGTLPPSWFDLFHRAALTGTLTRSAWGAAARMTYTHMPTKLRGGLASRRYLEGFRLVDPAGLMSPVERAALASQPSSVTLYRGAVAMTLQDAAQGLNWTFERRDAQLGIFRRRMGFYGPQRGQGREFILKAVMPKRAIIGIMHRPCGERVDAQSYGSVLVDFEMIELSGVTALSTDNLQRGILGSMLGNVGSMRSRMISAAA